MSYLDIKFPDRFEYSSDSDPIPIEFFLDVLPKSKNIYLKLGYFSSRAIQVLAYGFAQFIYHGGTIKIITNHYLYDQDAQLISGEDNYHNLIQKQLSIYPSSHTQT